jgi:DNA invertase Pin-like site-specific DNA recombinase
MKSAYLYVRVSTDEQKRKGYSLVEQENHPIRHCEIYGIRIKGIYRENTHRPPENILFIKWDRFGRNIEYAYQMIEC